MQTQASRSGGLVSFGTFHSPPLYAIFSPIVLDPV